MVGACYKPYDSEVAASSDVASSFGFTVTFSSLNPRVLTIEAMVLFLVSNAESHSSGSNPSGSLSGHSVKES